MRWRWILINCSWSSPSSWHHPGENQVIRLSLEILLEHQAKNIRCCLEQSGLHKQTKTTPSILFRSWRISSTGPPMVTSSKYITQNSDFNWAEWGIFQQHETAASAPLTQLSWAEELGHFNHYEYPAIFATNLLKVYTTNSNWPNSSRLLFQWVAPQAHANKKS